MSSIDSSYSYAWTPAQVEATREGAAKSAQQGLSHDKAQEKKASEELEKSTDVNQ